MKKLLIATDCFLPRWDGVSRFLLEIIPHLRKDFEITVLAPDFGKLDEKLFHGINVIRFPTTRFYMADYNLPKPSMRRIKMEAAKNDIIFTQTLGPIGYLAMKYGKRKGKKVIAYIHSVEWELVSKGLTKNEFMRRIILKVVKYFAKRRYNSASLLLIPSKGISEMLTQQGINTERKIVHLAANTEIFKPAANKDEAKRKIGIGGRIIGFCGRIGKEKNLETLYKAFQILKEAYPDIKLLFVADGPQHQKDKFKEAIITGNTDPVPYLQAMDIFVLPSLTETTSLSTMEAMSTGLPVVVTKVGYLVDYVTDGINGFFTPKKDPRKMAEKIERLLVNEELRKSFGENGRKTIQNHYSWDKTSARLIEILKGVYS